MNKILTEQEVDALKRKPFEGTSEDAQNIVNLISTLEHYRAEVERLKDDICPECGQGLITHSCDTPPEGVCLVCAAREDITALTAERDELKKTVEIAVQVLSDRIDRGEVSLRGLYEELRAVLRCQPKEEV